VNRDGLFLLTFLTYQSNQNLSRSRLFVEFRLRRQCDRDFMKRKERESGCDGINEKIMREERALDWSQSNIFLIVISYYDQKYFRLRPI